MMISVPKCNTPKKLSDRKYYVTCVDTLPRRAYTDFITMMINKFVAEKLFHE